MLAPEVIERILSGVSQERLVAMAREVVAIPSPTGEEQAMAEHMRRTFRGMGLQVQWQEVEEGRPNVVGLLEGEGGGPSLMFNGHMDTSYSGREPWLQGIGYRPEATIRDGYLYGLGISNMKGALCCYLEALRALQEAGVRLKGDLVIAAVVGEIEKTQWGDEFQGKQYRGYAAGSRHLVTHGVVTDRCIIGEPTERRIILGHYGTVWMRLSTRGPFVHTAFSRGRGSENSILRMRDVLGAVEEWIPSWERATRYRGREGLVNIGSVRGGFPWRVSRTPGRTDLFLDCRVPPTMPMTQARGRLMDFVRELRRRFPDYGIEAEIYVSAPGSEIAEDSPLLAAIDAGHQAVYGEPAPRDTVGWFSDASVLTRYGIETVNFGISSGLPGPEGENLEIQGLVDMARVYAVAAAAACQVAP